MSSRGNPFAELERLFERMSRQFDDDIGLWQVGDPFERGMREVDSTAVDLVEHDEEFVVTLDLPGFEKEDVEIRVTDRTLHVEAEREEAESDDDEAYIRRERRHESLRQSVRLPEDVEKENVTARMKHGVLTVTLPKLAVEESRTIEIAEE